MADKAAKSIKFPGLSDTYIFLQNDTTLSEAGKAADAKVTGDQIAGIRNDYALKTELPVTVLTPSGDTHTLLPCPVTYSFGTKTTLTVTMTDSSEYHFMFTCPSGAVTALTMNGITGRAGDTLAAGKTYEVDVWAGIAMVRMIEVTAV